LINLCSQFQIFGGMEHQTTYSANRGKHRGCQQLNMVKYLFYYWKLKTPCGPKGCLLSISDCFLHWGVRERSP